MAKINQCVMVVVLLMIPLHSYSAGFDCAKAGTWVEKTLCADPQLSDLDSRLMLAYRQALPQASGVKSAQITWLTSVRNACQDIACLKQAYTSRLAELDATASSPTTQSPPISGEYKRYYQGKPDKNESSITIKALADGRLHVEGNAVWVGNVETGNVNLGELAGSFPLDGNQIHYTDGENDGCKLTITFSQNALTVSGDDNMRCGGLNVTFDGQYRKAR